MPVKCVESTLHATLDLTDVWRAADDAPGFADENERMRPKGSKWLDVQRHRQKCHGRQGARDERDAPTKAERSSSRRPDATLRKVRHDELLGGARAPPPQLALHRTNSSDGCIDPDRADASQVWPRRELRCRHGA